MAKKNPEYLPPAKLIAIWKQISLADWMSILQEYRPDNRWTVSGEQIKGLCIYHPDSSPSMVINPDRGSVYCFGNTCHHREWDPIRFVAKLSGEEYATALRKMKSRFGIKLPSTFVDNLQQLEEHNEMKLVLLRALNAELVDALANSSSPDFAYANTAKFFNWFRKRQFPEDSAHLWPVGLLPPRDRLYTRLSSDPDNEKYIEPMFEYLKKYLATPGNPQIFEGCLVFFYFQTPTQVGRPRLRKPETKDFYAIEDPYNEKVGFFGLNCFPHLTEEKNRPLYAIEGEMDALSIITHQFSTGADDVCIVGTGGSMDTDLDCLATFGFEEIYLIGDNDPAGVDWALDRVSKNTHTSRVFRWTPNDDLQQVKDMDEAVRKFGFSTMYDRLRNPDSLPRVIDWMTEQLDVDLQTMKDKDDIRAKTEKAAKFGSKLKSEADRQQFIDHVCSTHGVSREAVLQDMIPDEDTMESFILRLEKKLDKEYKFLSERSYATGTAVSAWSLRKRIMRPLMMNSLPSFQAALEADLGRLDEYVKNELGEPSFLTHRLDSKGNPHAIPPENKLRLLGTCFKQAVTGVMKKLAPRESLEELGQGLHIIEHFEDNGKQVAVLINGSKFFQGEFVGNTVTWQALSCPITSKYFFRLQNQGWSPNLQTVEDLTASASIDPKQVFSSIRDILRTGWRFLHHDLETTYLAANILYTPIADVFKMEILTDITGDTHSGKTTLMRCIAGGIPDIRLCDATITMEDYTAAAIRQTMAGCRLHLFLDEFEDRDTGVNSRTDRHTMNVREILEIFRNLRPGARAMRGALSGSPLEYNLWFPATVCGMHTMRETRDLNRYVHLKLKVIDGMRDPLDPIREKYPAEKLEELRRQVTLCFLSRLPEIKAKYAEVKAEFTNNEMLPSSIISRFKDNLLPLVTILKYIGEDYMEFIKTFSELKMEEMRQEGGMTKRSDEIWSQIIQATISLGQHGESWGGFATLAKVLIDPTRRQLLDNAEDLGVYFIEEKKWLVVFWQKAVTGILKYSPTYKNTQYPGKLKMDADDDRRIVPVETLKRGNFMKKEVWPRVGTHVSTDEISVIDLTTTLFFAAGEEAEENEAARVRMIEDIPGVVGPKVNRGNFEV